MPNASLEICFSIDVHTSEKLESLDTKLKFALYVELTLQFSS